MIIQLAVYGAARNQSYNRLAELTDKFGGRLSGSAALENAIDYMIQKMTEDGLDNVHGETVMVPNWERGDESAAVLQPRYHPMSILGLGSSVGTPVGGITAEALIVKSFDELHRRAAEAKGKIVVYNQDFVNYGVSVMYRGYGASEAAKVGGVASLVRSVTPLSVYSPHTGIQMYSDGVPKIPTASITVEDAEMMWRMSQRGERIVIFLNMSAQNYPMVESRNTVAEIIGSKYPEQVVLVSGHLDSWDVGQGAMDDGGGAIISWQALSLVKQLGLRPKRTMRAVLWTAEEQGMVGSQQYYEMHKVNVSNYDLVMESDIGTFIPTGIDFSGIPEAFSIMEEVVKLLAPINASNLVRTADGGDVSFWIQDGVPGGSLINENDKYFYFHHSNGRGHDDSSGSTPDGPVFCRLGRRILRCCGSG
ncbi:hypothetical protein CHS0354_032429 [Potamilus streckersoni]|uniref:Carboxypeptidase Q n=1 Tax=Potamilus streckersoni TaxID=2493646 RepID=A0AAE0W0F9_9BIVA|nr:hypothetical protein CHS0354_032429 [Potamilus streckersoni]